MMNFILVLIITVSFALIAFIYRLIKGPTSPDRVIALDAIGVAIIALVGLLSIYVKTTFFVDIALLLAILSFIGTIAFSKFIEKGDIIDRDNTH
ncbi:MAG: Na(+)/H(+) antiporter subunit F1 [Kurthia sp.]|nr:Na(+)/H(+) antiporter subunit F1 [Candidatus Kurthia equi]